MAKGTVTVPTRMDRIAKRNGSLSTSKADVQAMPYDIEVVGRQATVIEGFIMAVTADSVTLRHKAKAGSSKQIVSTFPNTLVIERMGSVGEIGQITVIAETAVRTLKGQKVTVKGGVIIATDWETGEVTEFNMHVQGYTVNLVVDETAAAKRYGYEAGSKTAKGGKGKAEKPAKAKGKKSKAADEEF